MNSKAELLSRTPGERATPIILAHGTPWSSFNLRHLIDGLSDEFQVYYFDLLGYGQSDQSDGDVSLGIQNKALAAMIDYWELDAPIAIGHDFGGATVLRAHLLNEKVLIEAIKGFVKGVIGKV